MKNDAAGPGGVSGRYRDRVHGPKGRLVEDRGWRSNTLVHTAWPLIAALLKNEPGFGGLRYCAVGEGDASWDDTPAAATAASTRLVREKRRVPVRPEDVAYVDGLGRPVSHPTARLEVRAIFGPVPESQTLREFGLFGGDAAETPDSGYMINYVIHPRLDLRPRQALTRQLVLSFRPGGAPSAADWMDLPPHGLGRSPVTIMDGVGDVVAKELERAGIRTVDDLARTDPMRWKGSLAVTKLVELRAKARLTLRTTSAIGAMPGLQDRTIIDILSVPPGRLAKEAALPAFAVEMLHEQLGALQLGLDARTLRRMTLRELQGGP